MASGSLRPVNFVRPVVVLAVLAFSLLLPRGAAAQIRPDAAWLTLESAHFRVTYPPGLETLARYAAQRAEIARVALIRDLAPAPRGTVDIVLTDDVDVANGSATPLPSNRIIIYAHPPLETFSLEYQLDWIDLLVTHELTHIFHFDRAGRIGHALRTVFGRVPFSWPFFPVIGTPTWSYEGLAVEAESHLVGGGRLHGSYHEMAVRTALLEGRFDPIDRVSNYNPVWPGGSRPYIYGSLYLDYLARTYGEDVNRRIVDATASAWLPPALLFDRIGSRAIGRSFSATYRDWRRSLESEYAALADSLAATGLTDGERITNTGRWTLYPRHSPDGRQLALAVADGRETTVTRVVDPNTGSVLWERRRNSTSPSSWLPDGSGIVYSQLDFVGRYSLFEDLYILTLGGERRLTTGARLHSPDVAADGRSVVVIETGGGTNRVAVFDLVTGALRPLHGFQDGVHWTGPRWAPDGRRLAVSRWTRGGGYDLVVLDAATGNVVREITADRAIDGGAAWTPDGRYLLFSSDRTGIPNLFAAEPDAPAGAAPRQVTNVLTGALQPDLSPDGRWIHYVRYHAGGYDIERIPFDPATWRDAAPFALDRIAETRAPAFSPDMAPAGVAALRADTTTGPAGSYHGLWHARPRYWLPIASGTAVTGTFIGLATSGADLVGRHAWSLLGAADLTSGLWEADLWYAWAGLGNPVVELQLARSWKDAGTDSVGPAADQLVERTRRDREDLASVRARFAWPGVRASLATSVGGEYVLTRRELPGTPAMRLRDDRDALVGAVASLGFGSARMPALAISPQDGVLLGATVRRRWERAPQPQTIDRSYSELSGSAQAYRSVDAFGFARHVLAARGAGIWRGGVGAPLTGVGGVTGERFLPVRGYAENTQRGTEGWSASAEYRVPIALVARGAGLLPLFLDRVSAAAFIDAGQIRCGSDVLAARPSSCQPAAGAPTSVLAAVGAELVTDAVLMYFLQLRLRTGVGVPLTGGAARFHVTVGPSF